MNFCLRVVCLLLLTLCVSRGLPEVRAQEGQQAPAESPSEFVSGTVVDYSNSRIVVNRAVVGKPAENHTFTVTQETVVEGTPRRNSRVTVGYKKNDSGELLAVRIIVRQQSRERRL